MTTTLKRQRCDEDMFVVQKRPRTDDPMPVPPIQPTLEQHMHHMLQIQFQILEEQKKQTILLKQLLQRKNASYEFSYIS